MNILVLNGSPHKNGGTNNMVNGFIHGAEDSGHSVKKFDVAFMNIHGCLGCDYCRKHDHACVQKDDMQLIFPYFNEADMIVFASPIYYFTLSAQLHAAIQRTYAPDIPEKCSKTVLILNSGSRFVHGPAVAAYQSSIVEYWNVQNAGVFCAWDEAGKTKEKYDELYAFGRSL